MLTSSSLSRRQFIRSAGGITFLALAPVGHGLFAALPAIKPLVIPHFTALPYIQPGPEGLLIPKAEAVRLVWQTVRTEADFEVRYGREDTYSEKATIIRAERDYSGKNDKASRYNYVSAFSPLDLGTEYRYRVICNGTTIAEGYFTTRQPRGRKIRFVAFGDNSFGDLSDRAIAYQAYRANPDFIMNTGDNVYESGLDTEYSRFFFPVYNADIAGPRIGAPLLRSIPFYSVLANHDIEGKDPETKHPCADFEEHPDGLGYYTNFHFPLNGPSVTARPTTIRGPADRMDNFKACAADRFPRMANYSYDVGEAHFLCLDSNVYVDPTDETLQEWIAADLSRTDGRWKFVTFHHPPFNVGAHHFREQQMRILAPLFEQHGVSFVLSGHEHNYQRTQPIRFKPTDLSKGKDLHSKDRRVPGEFKVDNVFDGETKTRPDGILYLTTGAGGKYLYDAEFNNAPSKWTLADDKNVAYVARMVSDRHSLTVFDVERDEVLLRQIDEQGNEIDRVRVTI